MTLASGTRAQAAHDSYDTYSRVIEQAKSQARRYAALETRDGRAAAVAVLRFARSLRARRSHLHA